MSNNPDVTFHLPDITISDYPHKLTEIPDQTPLLFLSDVHLGAHNSDRNGHIENQLIKLLEYCDDRSIQLIVLGDLFDYWLEYNGWHPSLGHRLLKSFQTYHKQNPSTIYITGNHDHWHLQHFEYCGFDVEDEFRILNLDNQHLFILHGDGLADNKFKLPRSAFNELLRTSGFNRIYRTLFPPSIGLTIMKYISTLNKWLESEEEAKKKSILKDWARELLNHSDLDAVVCGHNHNPQVESFQGGSYLNPGFYGKQQTLGRYTNHKFELVTWDDSAGKIVPYT